MVDYDTALRYLKELYDKYHWNVEESGGRNPLTKSKNVLKYYAILMNSWINSEPINKIIITTLKYYEKKEIWIVDHNEDFDRDNKLHINTVINKLIGDIENMLRFKLEKYFNNYHMLIKEKFGEIKAGANWSEFLE